MGLYCVHMCLSFKFNFTLFVLPAVPSTSALLLCQYELVFFSPLISDGFCPFESASSCQHFPQGGQRDPLLVLAQAAIFRSL